MRILYEPPSLEYWGFLTSGRQVGYGSLPYYKGRRQIIQRGGNLISEIAPIIIPPLANLAERVIRKVFKRPKKIRKRNNGKTKNSQI